MTTSVQICSKCVMDTTDPDIVFDEAGICHHCHIYTRLNQPKELSVREAELQALVASMKKRNSKRRYDCVIGVSGGVDSTYVAYRVKSLGLRPVAVHLDNGWDSELAVKNIENTLRTLEIDLITHVIDWDEFRDIQLSFLKASTPDSEIPSDHAIASIMYQKVNEFGVGFLITGYNHRTESHLPSAWSQGHFDWRYIRAVHRQYGSVPIRTFPHMSFIQYNWYRLRQQSIAILDYLDYSKPKAMELLQRDLGWQYYGGKHYESIYTRFYQGYILPRKFGFDKRKCHFSSLICAGELSREEALEQLKEPPYPEELAMQDREYVIKKLGLDEDGFEKIMNQPIRRYADFPSYGWIYANPFYKFVRSIHNSVGNRRG